MSPIPSSLCRFIVVCLLLLVSIEPAFQLPLSMSSEESGIKRVGSSDSNHNILRFGRGTPTNILRFGRAGHNIMHFGKRGGSTASEDEISMPITFYESSNRESSIPEVLDVDPSVLYVNKKTVRSLGDRFLIPHFFLSSFYNDNKDGSLSSSSSSSSALTSSTSLSSFPFSSALVKPSSFEQSVDHSPSFSLRSSSSFPSSSALSSSSSFFAPLSRMNSYSGSFNKKASDPRDRDNVFMHFG